MEQATPRIVWLVILSVALVATIVIMVRNYKEHGRFERTPAPWRWQIAAYGLMAVSLFVWIIYWISLSDWVALIGIIVGVCMLYSAYRRNRYLR